MIDDANTQRYTTEKISTTPAAHGGILVTQVREPSLSSRIDEEELDRHFTGTGHQFSEVSLGLNASTLSAAEKSFRREDYIYVGFFLPLFPTGPS